MVPYFSKGPMLSATKSLNSYLDPEKFLTVKAYKNNLKITILALQSEGDTQEWQNSNFITNHVTGLRKLRSNDVA